MKEVDRVTTCVFCEVKNYMIVDSLQRFVLPDKVPEQIRREDIIYFPYMRFKGNIFSCQGREVESKVLDTTHKGLDVALLSPTLGVRPQAMKVHLVDENLSGKFVRRKDTAVTILQRATMLAEAFSESEKEQLFHRAFIGETVSCIYLPLYIKDGTVYDGVLNKALGKVEPWLEDVKSTVRYRQEWKPAFLATICPQCGADMDGENDSLILHCYSCNTCWAEKGSKFVRVPYSQVVSQTPEILNLPFWRIEVVTRGIRMHTFADFLKVTNQPVMIKTQYDDTNLEFWIPAVKLRPKIFLKLAKSATLSQEKFPEGSQKLKKPLIPITMPLKEAIQSLKSIVAETTVNRKDVLPQLPNLSISVTRSSLAFLPFENTGHDLVQEHSALSVATSVVQHGRKL